MGVSYKIDKNKYIVYMKMEGEVTVKDIIFSGRLVHKDKEFESGMHNLADFSEANLIWDGEDISLFQKYINSIVSFRGICKWGVVLDKDLKSLLISLFEDESTIEIKVFSTPEEAEDWILS